MLACRPAKEKGPRKSGGPELSCGLAEAKVLLIVLSEGGHPIQHQLIEFGKCIAGDVLPKLLALSFFMVQVLVVRHRSFREPGPFGKTHRGKIKTS